MKKYYILFISLIVAFNVNANKLQAYLSYATFLSPADGPYIETYLSVVGNSVKFIKNERI